MLLRTLILTSFLIPASVAKQKDLSKIILDDVQVKYSKAKFIKTEVEKKLVQPVLKKTKESNGSLVLAGNGKFRLEFKDPDKSLMVSDGKNMWVVQYPDLDSEKIQVIHSKVKEQLKSQVLLSFLMGKEKVEKHFKIMSRNDDDGILTFKLEPKEEGTDLKDIRLEVDSDKKVINKISYKDTLDNETSFKFSNNKFEDEVKTSLFKFKIPKNAEVTEN